MSCKPVIDRLIENAIGERLRELQKFMQERLGQFMPVVHTNIPMPAQAANQAAYAVGQLVGSVIAPLIPNIPIPPWFVQQEQEAAQKLALGVATGTIEQQEVAHCISHIVGELVSGQLVKRAAKKAGFR